MAYGFMSNGQPVPVAPPRPPGPSRAEVSSLMDRQLAEQAANAGRMLEDAYSVADRELALIWQRTMFDIVKLRRARRFGPGTDSVNGGGA